MKWSRFYIAFVFCAFLAMAVALNVCGRTYYSESEKRELKTFPVFSLESLFAGDYTEEITAWYSDSVPYRDEMTSMALLVSDAKGMSARMDGEEIVFHNVGALSLQDSQGTYPENAGGDDFTELRPGEEGTAGERAAGQSGTLTTSVESLTENLLPELTLESETETEEAHINEQIDDQYVPVAEAFTKASNGIIITGSGENTRAIMLYGGKESVTTRYAEVANHYKELYPDINVYVSIIPTSVAYYCPEKALSYTGSELQQINNIMDHLREDVIGIDLYTILSEHRAEPIFLRTDHHWAPLGAYYAASKIAETAKVPFLPLSDYEEKTVHRYVGSMYMYSGDSRVKAYPEDFVYYVPTTVEYTTTYMNYSLDAKWNIIGEQPLKEGKFFYEYKDGSSGAYCTFMGGDAKITQVVTDTKNGRKLMILKDSFGNAIPGFLFGSFEEIHVIDSRYFTRNICDYIEEHGITDILFANNAFHAATQATINSYERYLTQGK